MQSTRHQMDVSKTVRALIILGTDGQLLVARYFDESLEPAQLEKQLFAKTKSIQSKEDILVLDRCLIFHKYAAELHLYVVGYEHENPLILNKLLSCLTQLVSEISNKPGSTKNASPADRLDQIILALDEVCDEGIILETSCNSIMETLSMKEGLTDSPSYVNLLQSATEQFRLSLMRQ